MMKEKMWDDFTLYSEVRWRIQIVQLHQPHSQALSSLPPLVIERKTLVVAGHMTTKNLGGKKTCWAGGVAECFDCCCDKRYGFQNLEKSPRTSCFYIISGFQVEFCQ